MNNRTGEGPALTLSLHLYEVLLLAYPASFRREYGPAMLQVFRDRMRRKELEHGQRGMLGWWAIALIDLGGTVLAQHLQKEAYMTVPNYIRASGWALMVGALAIFGFFPSILYSDTDNRLWWLGLGLMLLGSLLVSVGVVGLRHRFGEQVGPAGRTALMLGIAGSLLSYTALGEPVWRLATPANLLPFAGPGILMACLGVFGIIAWRKHVLPAATGLPMMGAIWLFLLLGASIASDNAGGGGIPSDLVLALGWAGNMLTTFGLIRLGWILQSNADHTVTAVGRGPSQRGRAAAG
jgi:hypothetical protein